MSSNDSQTTSPRPAVADLDIRSVEREITTLAGHLTAGTCRYLELLAALGAVREPAVIDDEPPASGPAAGTAGASAAAEAADGGNTSAEAQGSGNVSAAAADAGVRAAGSDAAALVTLAAHALARPAPTVGSSPVRLIVHTTDQAPHDRSAAAAAGAPTTADPASAEAPPGSAAPLPALRRQRLRLIVNNDSGPAGE